MNTTFYTPYSEEARRFPNAEAAQAGVERFLTENNLSDTTFYTLNVNNFLNHDWTVRMYTKSMNKSMSGLTNKLTILGWLHRETWRDSETTNQTKQDTK